MRPVVVSVLLAFAATLVTLAPDARADARTEAVAKAALKKAKADFKSMNYGTGATRLQKALRACGDTKCKPETRAALLLDIGAMQLKKGSKDEANLSFAAAVKASPSAALEPPFDAPDVAAAFDAAAHPAASTDTSGGGAPPTGDFGHTAPTEQAVDTPLPIYVDGGPDSVVRVVLKYKPEGASSWKRITLKKMDEGWAGLVPCGDVTAGTLRYYVQGFDETKTPVANNGDARHPYKVAIKSSISGDAPHLPGKAAPKSCSESSDCPPDFPGCSKSGENAGAEGDDNGDGSDDGAEAKAASGPFKRIWLGVGAELEFVSMPTGSDVCALDPNSALPVNGENLYCTNQANNDFPTRNTQAENAQLCTAAAFAAHECPGDAGGSSAGGLVRGDMRIMVSFDYAITPNFLAGARLGVTLFDYPGSAAINDGRASGLSRFYGEARATYVFGGIDKPGFKPLVFGGAGVGEFDGHVSTGVAYCNSALTPNVMCKAFTTGTVNVWKTAGPLFFDLGGGVRWAATENIALTGALRLNLAIGGGGLLPTYGPELAAAYGF